MLPWEYFEDLTEERLTAVALLLAKTRQTLVPMFNESTDDGWSHGCRALTACRKAILRNVSRGDLPFVKISASGRRFIFSIGKVPFRFFRGDAEDEPIEKVSSSIQEEGEQLALLFPGEQAGLHLRWRFAIEATSIGPADRIFVLGVTEAGIIECKWEVPLLEADLSDLDALAVDDEGEEVAAPEVGFKKKPAAREG